MRELPPKSLWKPNLSGALAFALGSPPGYWAARAEDKMWSWRNNICRHHQAAIAQLGERQTEDLKVPGSIPGLGMPQVRGGRNGPLKKFSVGGDKFGHASHSRRKIRKKEIPTGPQPSRPVPRPKRSQSPYKVLIY